MKTQKDKENENLSIFCGVLVFAFIAFIILLSMGINFAIDHISDQVSKDYKKALETQAQQDRGL